MMVAWFVFVLVLFAILAILLTYGLERQRQELAGLRREIEDWVAADLRLKRARLGLGLKQDFDPAQWLVRVVRQGFPNLSVHDNVDLTPQTGEIPGVWVNLDHERFFVTPRNRDALKQYLKGHKGRLEGPTVLGDLSLLSRSTPVRISLAHDPLLDLAWLETARRLSLPEEEPQALFVYRAQTS